MRAPRSREWVFKASIVTHRRCSVEFTYKQGVPFVRRAYETGVNNGFTVKCP
jgi:hypothetical protein